MSKYNSKRLTANVFSWHKWDKNVSAQGTDYHKFLTLRILNVTIEKLRKCTKNLFKIEKY